MPEIIGLNFPDYMFREYPKWIECPDGKLRLAETAEEEAELLEAEKDEAAEREDLLAEAADRGIKVDKRWGIERLRAALA